MTTDTLLIEKREELKRRLAAGEYKTLVDVFLEWFESLIRKITRRTEPLSIWYVINVLFLTFILIGITIFSVTGDLNNFREFANQRSINYSGTTSLYLISLIILSIASTAVIKQYIDRILVFCHNEVLDATETITSLHRIEAWLSKLSNRWLNFIIVAMGGSLGGLYLVAKFPGSVSGYGFTIFTIIYNLFNWNIVYLLIMVIFLSTTLHLLDLKLFTADPASSELVIRLSGVLSFAVYFVAGFAAILTLILSLAGLLSSFGYALLLFFWLPLVALFILNQTSLASIIRRAKWKTLNEIQTQVEELRTTGSLKDKETMEAINRLMDFHDRVKATRNSAIDSNTIINFINSLLLPLLAFLLGNLDKVWLLFAQKP